MGTGVLQCIFHNCGVQLYLKTLASVCQLIYFAVGGGAASGSGRGGAGGGGCACGGGINASVDRIGGGFSECSVKAVRQLLLLLLLLLLVVVVVFVTVKQ